MWTVDTLTTARAPMTENSLVGGNFPATSFEAYDSTGAVTTTTTALGMQVNWRTASLTNGNRTFTGARSFLQSHPSYTWRINTNNITDTNSAVLQIQQSNFRNGTVTFGGAGSPAGTSLPAVSVSFGGNANAITFTSCLLYTSPSPRDS